MNNELNDSLDDLLGGPVSNTPRTAVNAPVSFVENKAFIEGCKDCRGTGWWRPGYCCFKCKGAGKLTFKTSPEARKIERERSAHKKVEKAVELRQEVEAWKQANAEIWTWILANVDSFSFAASMNEALHKFGSLTDGQKAGCQKCIDGNKARAERKAAERAEQEANAPVVDTAGIDRLKASFDQAIAYSAEKGLKLAPRITINGVTISPAKATSANPGALYVKEHGGEYLGKIKDGKFFAVPACNSETQTKILSFIADPQEAAKVYGQTTGTCCICNATLRSEWKLRGIGPICAEKFGW